MWKCKCKVMYESMASKTYIILPITFVTYDWDDKDDKTDELLRVAYDNKPTGYVVKGITLISEERF